MMKNIILTIDYEVFLGAETGNIKEVLIEPTNKLMELLDINNSKMTVFWDVLHYYAICMNVNSYPELREDKILIENQIQDMVRRGHDVQMHIHPHWVDAKYVNHKWVFDYSRFSIQKFNSNRDENDINSIYGCLYIARRLMESVIFPINKNHIINTYRAGGYLIEPFQPLREVLLELGITIDSSTCPGSQKTTAIYPYDFRGYPTQAPYRFTVSPQIIDNEGDFTEYPIFINRLWPFIRLKNYFALRCADRNNFKPLTGKGVNFPEKGNTYIETIIKHFRPATIQLTTDGLKTGVLFYDTLKKAPNYSVMILHPKMQTSFSFKVLEENLNNDIIKFIPIKAHLYGEQG